MAAVFADLLESTREPGTSWFSASGVASILGLQQQDLAGLARVHRNTLGTHPESLRLQTALRDIMRVLSAAAMVQPDPVSFYLKTIFERLSLLLSAAVMMANRNRRSRLNWL